MLNKKAQFGNWNLVIALLIITIAMTAGFYIWQGVSVGGIPTSPEDYVKDWKKYGETVFKTEDQPWRMVGMFFFPFLVYFSLLFFAFNVTLVGLQRRFTYVYRNIERPIVVLCFAIAFLQLPFPLTYSLYGWLGSLTPILLVFAWIIPIVGMVLVFYALRGQFQRTTSVGGEVPSEGRVQPEGQPVERREGEKKETEKKEEKTIEESKGRDLLENWRRAIEGYWRLLDKIKNFSIDKKILNFSSHQDWGNFCEALKNLEDVKRKVYRLVREMREGLHEVDNLERLRNLFREWYPSHILPELLNSLDELERQYHIAKQKSSLLEGKIDELISGVKEDMKNSYRLALQRLIKEYSSKLLLYKDLIDYRNSDAGNLKALRNKTIKELGINF